MKILFHLLDAGIGGGQRIAAHIAQELAGRGHEIDVMVPATGQALEMFPPDTAVHIVELRSLRRAGQLLPARRVVARSDLLYSHVAVPGAILGELAAVASGRPHVVHQHSRPHFSANHAAAAAQRVLFAKIAGRARFVAVAPHIAAELGRLGIRQDRVSIVPNGVPMPEMPPPTSRLPVVVGMLTRLDPGKGIETFLNAASEIDHARFVIGGAGGGFPAFEADVRQRAEAAGVGIVDEPDGPSFLSRLDVVVLPSLHEGSPLVLLESMALGKPVVASDIPGIREVIGSESGVLVPTGDGAALAQVLRLLVADAARRETIGRRARERVEGGYRLQTMLDRIVPILESAARA